MFSLFTGKISAVFSLALQGISKAIGFIVETVTDILDTVVETISAITSPITDALTELPLIGDTVKSVLTLESNLVSNLSDGLHQVADQLLQGALIDGVTTAVNQITPLVGQAVKDVVDVVDNVVGLADPVTDLLSHLPVVGDVVTAVGETTDNLLGFVAETGQYVADTEVTALVGELLTDPAATLGGVIQDVSGSLANVLEDLSPLTDAANDLPVVGDVVVKVGDLAQQVPEALYDVGTQISQIDLLNPLQNNLSYV